MPNVAFIKPELKKHLPNYDLVNDCTDGEYQIKLKKDKYLPRPNSTDVSKENQARYDAYLKRAIFYNVTKTTYSGLLGQIFSKETQIELPSELEFMLTNADGSGKGAEQLAKEGVGLLLKNSRFGILTEFPETNKPLSQSEIDQMNIRPSLTLFTSSQIINWRTKNIGAEIVYNLIVLQDKTITSDDGFEEKTKIFYKVLLLNEENKYEIQIWETSDSKVSNNSIFGITKRSIPTGVNGEALTRIPFQFCGSDNNDAEPDVPVLYDIAVLNIGHYRNSADYEETSFITGQPTPYFAGLTKEWVDQVLQGVVQLGARGAVPLPVGGVAGLIQAAANTVPIEAMKHKETQFLALGAKLVSPAGPQRSATEASIENATETSVLGGIANNCSAAFEAALKSALIFVRSSDTSKVIFKLNTDFEISKMGVAERNQLLNEWMKGAISFTEYRTNLRGGKVALVDDNKASAEIDAENAKEAALNPDPLSVGNQ